MNPLQRIEQWLLSLDPTDRINLLKPATFLHPSEEIRNGDLSLEPFMAYLKTDGLDYREIGARALVVTHLFNIELEGKDTEQYWRDAVDKNLDMRGSLEFQDTDGKEILDGLLNNLPKNKEAAMNLCKSWHSIYSDHLTDRHIMDWVFYEIFLKRKNNK